MSEPASVELAYKSILRRKQKNFFAIIGITLGVSLFAGVQISIDSLEVGWSNSYTHALGETQLIIQSIKKPFINESVVDKIQNANINGLKSTTGRLNLFSTIFWNQSGNIETDVIFMGVSSYETGFGAYYNKKGKEIKIIDVSEGEILLGAGLAKKLNTANLMLQVGDFLEISVAFGSDRLISQPMRIHDIFEDKGRGQENYAENIVVPLNWFQTQLEPYFGVSQINTIFCSLEEDINTEEKAAEVISDIYEVLSGVFEITDPRKELIIINQEITVLKLVSSYLSSLTFSLWVFGSVIILCGLLLIINIQLMTVQDRKVQTGIMRAIGMKKRQVTNSFLLEFLFMGLIGGVLGLIGGVIYGIFLAQIFLYFFQLPGFSIPFVITGQTIVISFLAGFFVSLITGILPSIRASNVNMIQVLRGIIPPDEEKFGQSGFYLGIICTILGVILFLLHPVIPTGPEAFKKIEDAEAFYLPVLLIIIGTSLILSFSFVSRETAFEIISLILVIWPLINIFVIFGWTEAGESSLSYLLYIIFSLIIGAITLVGFNLDKVALIGEKTVGSIKAFSAVATVAFRQMASERTRSTLTFAIFASVLTLNIFVATWTYSTRFGWDEQLNERSAEIDIIALSSQGINTTIDFASRVQNSFSNIEYASSLTLSERTKVFIEDPNKIGYIPVNDSSKYVEVNLAALEEKDLWNPEGIIQFPMTLEKEKWGIYETDKDNLEGNDEEKKLENEEAWKAVATNISVSEKGIPLTQDGIPVIITSYYTFQGYGGSSSTQTPEGKSIWLYDSSGEDVIHFKVIAYYTSNPLGDATFYGVRTGAFGQSLFYVSKGISNHLLGFQNSNTSLIENCFLFKTSYALNSENNKKLSSNVEQWANSPSGTFRQNFGMFGVRALRVWDVYEATLEAFYRVFQFIQTFTSLGFLVGVLGLLVVSIRSVSERKREIGMMRSLGFTQVKVILAVVLELFTMGLIGLLIGFLNGTILAWAFVTVNSGNKAKFLIPWEVNILYTVVTLGASFFSAIIPAWQAQKIPPSEALRYVG